MPKKSFYGDFKNKTVRRVEASWLVLAGAMVGLVFLIAGCETSPPDFRGATLPGNGAQPQPRAGYATNTLQEGDVVSVSFQYSSNFNTVQKIALDGVLNLDMVGAVKAAGRTVPELQTELARIYKPQIKDDVVTVKMVSSGNSVYISGAVIRPGKILMERPMTALEAIMEAGGFDPNRAKLSGVMVLRIEYGKQKTYRVNLKRVLNGGEVEPFYLQPFDIVHVPNKTFNF